MTFKKISGLASLILLLTFLLISTISANTNSRISKNKTDDYLVVVKNHPVIFDIIKKNNLLRAVEAIKILKSPALGEIYINGLDSLTYIPQPNLCEKSDQFTYIIETKTGIDTISVTVEILCEPLTIMSGFSPNNDGINDTFTILGIQNFPKNTLTIFNKWGEEVFYTKGYKNDWTGKTEDNDSLASEDSVYYYVFNDGAGKKFSGYLQIGESI